MKKFVRPIIILIFSLFIALACTGLTYSTQSSDLVHQTGAALFFQIKTTPTAQPKVDHSVVGSTDGIVIMGGIITLIVVVPIFMRRKAWMKGP